MDQAVVVAGEQDQVPAPARRGQGRTAGDRTIRAWAGELAIGPLLDALAVRRGDARGHGLTGRYRTLSSAVGSPAPTR